MKSGGKGGFIHPSVTLLGVEYQPMLRQKITRIKQGIDVFFRGSWDSIKMFFSVYTNRASFLVSTK